MMRAFSVHDFRLIRLIVTLLLAFGALAVSLAHADEGAAPPQRPSVVSPGGNTYITGGNIGIVDAIAADLIAAGGRVSVEAPVAADAALAGGAVDVRAPVKQDLRTAGGAVTVSEEVGGDLVAAGGNVQVRPTARIGGSAWLAGSEVRLAGPVARGVQVYGRHVVLASEIGGDAEVAAQRIEFAPGARIAGNLRYASPEPPVGMTQAQVGGRITRMDEPADRHGVQVHATASTAGAWLNPVFLIGMLAMGAVLFLFFPRAVAGIADTLRMHPGRSVLLGLAFAFTVPPVAMLSIITIIGLPLGISLLLLYPLALLLGYLATAFFLSRRLAAAMKRNESFSFWRQLLFLALALLVLSLALAIPFLGPIIFIVATVTGVGALVVWGYLRIRGTEHRAPSLPT